MTSPNPPTNFGFLAEHDALFVELVTAAEYAFVSDPNTTLIKLRQLGEALAQHLAAVAGVTFDEQTSQTDLLYRLNRELHLEPQVKELFHTLRIEGNKATHQFRTRHKEAMDGLKLARELAIWFHRSLGKAGTAFKPGPFVPPADPSAQLRQLQGDIEKLRHELQHANKALDSSQQLSQLVEQEKQEFEALALAMDEESRALAAQAQSHEQALIQQQQAYEAKIRALQTQLTAQGDSSVSQQRQQVASRTKAASNTLALSEELTRILIDQQLNEAGWEADSQEITYQKGARPEKGTYRAIAEWPTPSAHQTNGQKDRADYVLFCGLTPIAVVEAKKENANVAGKIDQAERYSKGLSIEPPIVGAWELAGRTIAWPADEERHFKGIAVP
ncbi:type I restriction endonuclease [Halomonas colorata]|uniref:type I restriction endonuclease n=1 Tax=Halomonas colorata TaxID=2742615 RepID=UPI001D0313D8|nr:type I restriction endonuclease [Halomonas colorata]